MTILKRSAAFAALMVFAAACGGGEAPQTETPETAATPEATTPAVETPATDAAGPAAGGTVHEVRMVTTQNGASGVFEPATLTVKQGDVIRFVNVSSGAAHNANFNVPENAGKANLPAATAYLTTEGQTADVTVSMDPGTYPYQCDPHAMMGMKGTITVQ